MMFFNQHTTGPLMGPAIGIGAALGGGASAPWAS